MIALGTGIGGGLVARTAQVYRGRAGVGGELGHMVLDCTGPDCPGDCPGRGCFEALVSGTAIGREGRGVAAERARLGARAAARRRARRSRGGLVTELAHDGDRLAREVLAEVGRAARLRARRRWSTRSTPR